ncbi:MAG: hypothetical protein S4CHLAM2_02050 [Chlamydiales bacterium]|nr:hypothetical protein [Chlamydiales bacterium]
MIKESIYTVPILHYTMEMALFVKRAFEEFKPEAVAVELPESMEALFQQAAMRLPDVSLVAADSLYFMCEPCDGAFEGLRSALEEGIPTYCIDLDVKNYPLHYDSLPDPYATIHIGLQHYYEAYQAITIPKHPLDAQREIYMARRLKELSLRHNKILYIGGMSHVASVLELMDQTSFPELDHIERRDPKLVTLTEDACREVMAESGWNTLAYEEWRLNPELPLLDRQKLLYHLYKTSAERYRANTGNPFPGYHLRNTMKYVRNYSFIHGQLMPDLFKILSAAKGCVDHNYAYETWYLATDYPCRKNIDNLPALNLSVEEVWKRAKHLRFHLKQKSEKGLNFQRRAKERASVKFRPPSPFSICSYPPEDVVVENFGEFLKKKGHVLLSEEAARSVPFSSSLEDGIDTRETIRHYFERTLYVKVNGRPPGSASSVVVIFNEDEEKNQYSWRTTWIGEHNQESDMAFYATPTSQNVVGPGISRCEYGGFLMTTPPRRLCDIWSDPDYAGSRSKAEVLLLAAIDYAVKPVIVYVAEKPPRSKIKALATRFGKKIIYIPIGQLSPILLNKIRTFHVLDGHDKREIAGDYIF